MPPVKREHSPSPTPYDRIKTSKPKPKATPKPEANSAGRKRLIEMTGLTVKQIQNHLGKGRSLRARLEEVAKIV
ncbi:hypothetical protein CcaverHIS641_0702970 [Cutaneotrichosporon cavernicola]|nr:hypothetical protein CcaverHIS641_0702970 [Cutaneotrichosporon cavernicola]